MISNVLQALEDGLSAVRSNSRMVMVVILLFVFPLLFVWVTQNFFTTAYDNINTAQKQRVGILHQTLAVALEQEIETEAIQAMITTVDSTNADITKIRILKKKARKYQKIKNYLQVLQKLKQNLKEFQSY